MQSMELKQSEEQQEVADAALTDQLVNTQRILIDIQKENLTLLHIQVAELTKTHEEQAEALKEQKNIINALVRQKKIKNVIHKQPKSCFECCAIQ